MLVRPRIVRIHVDHRSRLSQHVRETVRFLLCPPQLLVGRGRRRIGDRLPQATDVRRARQELRRFTSLFHYHCCTARRARRQVPRRENRRAGPRVSRRELSVAAPAYVRPRPRAPHRRPGGAVGAGGGVVVRRLDVPPALLREPPLSRLGGFLERLAQPLDAGELGRRVIAVLHVPQDGSDEAC